MMDLKAEPKRFDSFQPACNETKDCDDFESACFAYRQVYNWRGTSDAEWHTGHICLPAGMGTEKREFMDEICPNFAFESGVRNDHINSYVYEEWSCDRA